MTRFPFYSLGLCLSLMQINVYSFTPATNSKMTAHRLPTVSLKLHSKNSNDNNSSINRRDLIASTVMLSCFLGVPKAVTAKLEGVNNPKLLPREPGLNVIQTEKFLTSGQAKRLDTLLATLERDTGFRVRVLCQAYPNTPGLAIREYWDLGYEGQKDDKYVVLVVDQFGGRGNVLNFNVGEGVKLALPNIFWNRLQSKYGSTFYVRDNGIDLAITSAIESIVTCLRSEDQYCVNVPDSMPSLRSLGLS
jgi:TPM domain